MKKFIVPLILISSFVLRLYKGPELFFWNVDEDIIGLTVKRMLIDHRVQLIGFPIPGGIYLGPLFYYLISVFYLLTGLSPSKFYLISAIVGTVTTYLVYKVGALIFEKKAIGVIASIVWGVSYFSNVYNRLLTGLTIGPVLSLLTYWILYLNIKRKSPQRIFLLGVVLLIASQNEGSSFSLIVLSLLTLLIYKIKISKNKVTQLVILFGTFNIPLLIFDLRHNFYIFKSFMSFFESGRKVSFNLNSSVGLLFNTLEVFPNTLSRIIYPSGTFSTSAQILPCPELIADRMGEINSFVFLTSVFIIAIFLLNVCFKQKRTIGENLIALHFLTVVVGLLVFNLFLKGYVFEWVLVIFLPAFCFIIAYCLNYLYQKNIFLKILMGLATAAFLVFNVKAVLSSYDNFGLKSKTDVVKFVIEKVRGKDFYLDSLGSCYQTGYMYLFWRMGQIPSSSYTDDMFTPAFYSRANSRPKTTVVIASPSENETQQYFEKYYSYKDKAGFKQKVGQIEVLIIEE